MLEISVQQSVKYYIGHLFR